MSMFDAVEADPDDGPSEQPGRRHLSERQAEVMERLVAAAARRPRSGRTPTSRCGRSPSGREWRRRPPTRTSPGKDHLLAEVLWRRMQLPEPGRPEPAAARPGGRHRAHHGLRRHGVAGRGGVHDGAARRRPRRQARAVTARCRDRAPAGRPRSVPGADPAVLDVLQVTYTGALLSAGMGHLAFDAVPSLMAEATALMTGTGSRSASGTS